MSWRSPGRNGHKWSLIGYRLSLDNGLKQVKSIKGSPKEKILNATMPKYAFFGGRIVPMAEAKVGVMTHSFNYGTGVFAGMRAYWNADDQQLYIFRAPDHFE